MRHHVLRFADVIVDLHRRELSRGASSIVLRRQLFDALVFFLENRDRVVSRRELYDFLWGGVMVSDAALTNCIKSLRRALGDRGAGGKVIRTVHGVGYHFVAEVTFVTEPPLLVDAGQNVDSGGYFSLTPAFGRRPLS